MKKIILIIFLLTILVFSCKKSDVLELECTSILQEECVGLEDITSNQTGFYMFEKGLQEFGICSGIKINKEWNASPFIAVDSFSFFFALKTYTFDFNTFLQAEVFTVYNIPFLDSKGCYLLTSKINTTSRDSVSINYDVFDDDVILSRYKIDSTAENKLEILEFNQDTQKFRGKLKATFITDDPNPPVIPEKVRFFNVEIEIN